MIHQTKDVMHMPTLAQAEAYLADAQARNPGPWVAHSRSTAMNARLIAEKCPSLNADTAYIMGLLHDIGRREGYSSFKHTWDGYRFLLANGHEEAAAICLTHSFPTANIEDYLGEIDVNEDAYRFVEQFLRERVPTDYDRLIQLCDAISMPEGAVLIEKRLMDVVMRHGFPKTGSAKFQATFALKHHFDQLAAENIYHFLPNIVENTFGF